jgi:hypothetical protein
MMIMMKIPQIESLIINIKVLRCAFFVVLALYNIFYTSVASQNGYYGHFNDMNCNAIVIWWYEK